jgi:hypothetical protein
MDCSIAALPIEKWRVSVMKFSLFQWLAIVLLDVVLKVAYLFIISLNILVVPIGIFLTALHITMFIIARSFVRLLKLSRHSMIALTLFAANALFSGVSIFLRVSFGQGSRVTLCYGVKPTCEWINGTITPIGIRTLALETAIFIVLNLTALLIVIFSAGRSDPSIKVAENDLR